MKVYIAGPITNNPFYKKEFADAENKLIYMGYTPLNPCKHEGFEYKEYIDMGLAELSKCDAILLLENYDLSIVACLEYQYAKVTGMHCFKYENKEIVEFFPLIKRVDYSLFLQGNYGNEN